MPDMDTHVRRGHPILFGLITLFALIEGIITAWLVSNYQGSAQGGYPNNHFRHTLRFGVFVSWWTFVFAIAYIFFFLYGTGGMISSIASHAIWLFVTWVFWLALAASITNMLGGSINCGSSHLVYCHQNQAAQAFAWIEWILLTVAFAFVVVLATRSIRSGDKMSGPLSA